MYGTTPGQYLGILEQPDRGILFCVIVNILLVLHTVDDGLIDDTRR